MYRISVYFKKETLIHQSYYYFKIKLQQEVLSVLAETIFDLYIQNEYLREQIKTNLDQEG